MGSLEPGKDADFAIWNGSPLSPYSACEQTWIEGRSYFDRAADLAGREALARERDALIAAARAAAKDAPAGPQARRGSAAALPGGHRPGGNECGEHDGQLRRRSRATPCAGRAKPERRARDEPPLRRFARGARSPHRSRPLRSSRAATPAPRSRAPRRAVTRSSAARCTP